MSTTRADVNAFLGTGGKLDKKPFSEEEALFFWTLGYRFFSSVLRGYVMGHKKPLSAARDYLHIESLEGADREASEFLVDVASMGRVGGLSLEELYEKWGATARWRPGD